MSAAQPQPPLKDDDRNGDKQDRPFGVIQGDGSHDQKSNVREFLTQAGWTWISAACTLGTGLDEIFFRLLGLVIGPAARSMSNVVARPTLAVATVFDGGLDHSRLQITGDFVGDTFATFTANDWCWLSGIKRAVGAVGSLSLLSVHGSPFNFERWLRWATLRQNRSTSLVVSYDLPWNTRYPNNWPIFLQIHTHRHFPHVGIGTHFFRMGNSCSDPANQLLVGSLSA